MSFIKKHKIISALLLVLTVFLLLALLAGWFVNDKLNRISYDDGQIDIELNEPIETETLLDEPKQIITEEELSGLPEDVNIEIPEGDVFSQDGVFNILLLGTDERTTEFSDNARADSIMLLSLDKNEKSIKLVSLERGMGVPILDGEYEGQYDWITHCFRYGGASLMLKEVRECFQVDVDHYVRVNFSMFIQGIDAIGGIDITLTPAEADYINNDYHVRRGDVKTVTAGKNHMDGVTALAYSRIRKIDSDWRRIERQRNVIQAAVKQAEKINLLDMNNALDTMLPLVKTNLTKGEILSLVLFAPNLIGVDIEQMTIPVEGTYGGMTGMGGRSLYAVDFEANAAVLKEFFYGQQEP